MHDLGSRVLLIRARYYGSQGRSAFGRICRKCFLLSLDKTLLGLRLQATHLYWIVCYDVVRWMRSVDLEPAPPTQQSSQEDDQDLATLASQRGSTTNGISYPAPTAVRADVISLHMFVFLWSRRVPILSLPAVGHGAG